MLSSDLGSPWGAACKAVRTPGRVYPSEAQDGMLITTFSAVQTKTYHIFEEDGEPILHKAEGTEIEWKSGKNPTVKVSVTQHSRWS